MLNTKKIPKINPYTPQFSGGIPLLISLIDQRPL
jgi:hypothetical protein